MASISRQSNRRVQQPGILDYAVIDWQIQQRKDRVSAARYSMQQASKAVGATAPAVNHWACGVLQQTTYWTRKMAVSLTFRAAHCTRAKL
ncbi:unnamed protein product [Miscanthus lutarioriparius]|uniref:Uncharacterized protein n=1 Tax=Miscanthus lutarioriparius TaxID=422564 RepID=A0A811S4X8_9POAL|nr:unnamed protein product [Miscanthus lutarioriparius]